MWNDRGGFRDPAGHIVCARYCRPSRSGELASHLALNRAARLRQAHDMGHRLGGLMHDNES